MTYVSFTEWVEKTHPAFELDEASAAMRRPELGHADINMHQLQNGDLVDVGGTKKGHGKVQRLAKVIERRGKWVFAKPLFTNDGELEPFSSDLLRRKEDIDGHELSPEDQNHLKQLGANDLWVKLAPGEVAKIDRLITKRKEEADMPPEEDPLSPNFSSTDVIKARKNLFSLGQDDVRTPKPTRDPKKSFADLFADDEPEERPAGPLSGRVNAKKAGQSFNSLFGGNY